MEHDVLGPWWGLLDTGFVRAKIAFCLDSSIQGPIARLQTRAHGEVSCPVALDQEVVRFTAPRSDISIAVRLRGGELVGTCRHGGVDFPLSLRRGTPSTAPTVPRPQTPTAPLPYVEEEVCFSGADGSVLAGTLTLPDGAPHRGVVVLSPWFGRADRDQTTVGHKPLAVWADALTGRGYATLRYDKRGVGSSGGRFELATTAHFVSDLSQAVAWLRDERQVGGHGVGLLGHSEGGHVSAEVASSDPSISFCVLLTPTGVPDDDVLEAELFRAARAVGGVPVMPADGRLAVAKQLATMERAAADGPEAVQRVREVLAELAAEGRFPRERVEDRALLAGSPWRLCWLRYDYTAALRGSRRPTLAVFAGRDMQTPPDHHLPPVREALAANPLGHVIELAGLNHFLQNALTGAPSEYGSISETIAPAALEAVCDWIEHQQLDRR